MRLKFLHLHLHGLIRSKNLELGRDPDTGGEIIAEGIPEDVAKNPTSHTAKYLKKVLK